MNQPNPLLILPTIVLKTSLKAFEQHAKATFPHEAGAMLWGKWDGQQTIEIHQVNLILFPLETGLRHINFSHQLVGASKREAKRTGLIWIGSAHSHTTGECELSTTDHASGWKWGEMVSAVYALTQTKRGLRGRWGWTVPQGKIIVRTE